MEAVANADDTGNPCQSCFLNDAQLFNRIIIGKPDVGMSIKKLHGFLPKKYNRSDGVAAPEKVLKNPL